MATHYQLNDHSELGIESEEVHILHSKALSKKCTIAIDIKAVCIHSTRGKNLK